MAEKEVKAEAPKFEPHGHEIIVMAPNIWGRGKDLNAAMKNCEAQNGHRSLKGNWIAVLVPEGTGVDDMGYTRRFHGCPDCRRIAWGKEMKDEDMRD